MHKNKWSDSPTEAGTRTTIWRTLPNKTGSNYRRTVALALVFNLKCTRGQLVSRTGLVNFTGQDVHRAYHCTSWLIWTDWDKDSWITISFHFLPYRLSSRHWSWEISKVRLPNPRVTQLYTHWSEPIFGNTPSLRHVVLDRPSSHISPLRSTLELRWWSRESQNHATRQLQTCTLRDYVSIIAHLQVDFPADHKWYFHTEPYCNWIVPRNSWLVSWKLGNL